MTKIVTIVVVLAIGYVIGAKYPHLLAGL